MAFFCTSCCKPAAQTVDATTLVAHATPIYALHTDEVPVSVLVRIDESTKAPVTRLNSRFRLQRRWEDAIQQAVLPELRPGPSTVIPSLSASVSAPTSVAATASVAASSGAGSAAGSASEPVAEVAAQVTAVQVTAKLAVEVTPELAAEVTPRVALGAGSTSERTVFVRFQTPRGAQLRDVVLTERPLGLDFEHHPPLRVMHVQPGAHAALVGVQEDWVVVSVNGHELPGKDFAADFELFSECVSKLPLFDEDLDCQDCFAKDKATDDALTNLDELECTRSWHDNLEQHES
eukprot:NODE_11828_length_1262_cov_18.484581.p1 GENE.NODE_11828_length_1262_cov_18.484581~~NODE_11828_length_1262_cov_18.484581.p1  ORF type:complete len:291 (-),score=54.14 NODE_11828_length_1262_cov_18.484581:239-1111(-)